MRGFGNGNVWEANDEFDCVLRVRKNVSFLTELFIFGLVFVSYGESFLVHVSDNRVKE